MSTKINKIGIFGGTFDPVHIAHIEMAADFTFQMKLDKCIFVPANISPFKTGDEYIPASPKHRLNMLKLAVGDHDDFEVDTYEIDKKGVSYTYDTILYFRDNYNDPELFMLIGADHAEQFEKWGRWQEIIDLVRICIVLRPGYLNDNEKMGIEKKLTGRYRPVWIKAPLMDISGTDIRKKIRNSENVKYLLPEKVWDYISKNDLYR